MTEVLISLLPIFPSSHSHCPVNVREEIIRRDLVSILEIYAPLPPFYKGVYFFKMRDMFCCDVNWGTSFGFRLIIEILEVYCNTVTLSAFRIMSFGTIW
jgi:hypothetical protein